MPRSSLPRRALRVLLARERRFGFLNPYVAITTLVVLALERHDPIERPTPAPVLANDLSWWAIQGLGSALGIAILKPESSQAAAAVSGDARPSRSRVLSGLLDVLVIDGVQWAVHLVRHRSPLLWRFHATHHETSDLNQFSAHRLHPVDHLLSVALGAVALRIIGTSSNDLLRYRVLVAALGRTHHAAIDSDWPLLNKILVSPRCHRVHHSPDPDEFGTNFGVTFVVWDRLFGTYRSPGVSPSPTGPGPGGPEMRAATLSAVPRAVVHQLVAPMAPRTTASTAGS